ncbi:unnamed protein product [Gordionus sp. m RMFG-2023]
MLSIPYESVVYYMETTNKTQRYHRSDIRPRRDHKCPDTDLTREDYVTIFPKESYAIEPKTPYNQLQHQIVTTITNLPQAVNDCQNDQPPNPIFSAIGFRKSITEVGKELSNTPTQRANRSDFDPASTTNYEEESTNPSETPPGGSRF